MRCATHKFAAQQEEFAAVHQFASYSEAVNQLEHIAEGTFCLLLDNRFQVAECYLQDALLVECLAFEDDSFSLVFIKRQGATVQIRLPITPRLTPRTGLSLALLCTDTEPYRTHVVQVARYYSQLLRAFPPAEICLVYYGASLPPALCMLPLRIQHRIGETFHMSQARNHSLRLCQYSHTLMLDLDCYLRAEHLQRLLLRQHPAHHGVINLKDTPQTGNGLWYGETALFQASPYDERFQHAFFEDTHFMMQFSRQGIVPLVMQCDFAHHDHSRKQTTSFAHLNRALFFRLLKGEMV